MTVTDIKKLPRKFNFKSNIDTYGITYHATERLTCYKINDGNYQWKVDKQTLRRALRRGDYEIV